MSNRMVESLSMAFALLIVAPFLGWVFVEAFL